LGSGRFRVFMLESLDWNLQHGAERSHGDSGSGQRDCHRNDGNGLDNRHDNFKRDGFKFYLVDSGCGWDTGGICTAMSFFLFGLRFRSARLLRLGVGGLGENEMVDGHEAAADQNAGPQHTVKYGQGRFLPVLSPEANAA
jgi:hypothetical protein